MVLDSFCQSVESRIEAVIENEIFDAIVVVVYYGLKLYRLRENIVTYSP